jgi:hypothetical protein
MGSGMREGKGKEEEDEEDDEEEGFVKSKRDERSGLRA